MRKFLVPITLASCVSGTPVTLYAEIDVDWSADGSAGLLYDDNLTVVELDFVSQEKDYAALFNIGGDATVNLTDDDSVRAGYGFSQSKYFEFTQFNLQLHRTNLEYGHSFGDMRAALSHQYFHSNLGGDPLLDMYYLTPSLAWTVSDRVYLRAAYKYKNKDLTVQSARDAKTSATDFRGFYFFPDTGAFLTGSVQYEWENANADQFDFDAYILKGGYRMPLPVGIEGNRLDIDVVYEQRDYSSITPSIGAVRNDEKWTLGVAWKVPLTEVLFVETAYVYRDFKSNFPGANFTENNVTIDLGFDF